MATPKLKITYKKLEDLKPYERNARTHSDDQVAQIVASVKEFGWTNPIILDGKNGILAGHGRLMAAKTMGIKEVPTVDLVGLTPEQKRAYVLADNKLAMNAGWDYAFLKEELLDLDHLNYDLGLTGFSKEELENLFAPIDAELPELPDGDGSGLQQMTFTVSDAQAEEIKAAIDRAKEAGPFEGTGNENGNGNALARICEAY